LWERVRLEIFHEGQKVSRLFLSHQAKKPPFSIEKEAEAAPVELAEKRNRDRLYPLMILGSIMWWWGQMDGGFW